jgi:hypothetical protein
VNGTFESVTGQVASLGFDSPVLNALANAPIVSEGLYGTPPYEPSSSPSGGVWGEFWNAVSAVVTNPLGAVLAIVGEVWTLTLAVDTFVDHIAIEAAKIDGKLLSMEAAVIVHMGQIIEAAMVKLLNWIVTQIQSALRLVVGTVSAFESLMTNYTVGVDSAVDPSGSAAIWDALGYSPFELGFVVGVTVEAILILITALTLGPGFLVPVLVGAVVGALLTGAMYALSVPDSISTQLVSNAEAFAGNYAPQQSLSAEWNSWTDAASYWESGPSNQYAAIELSLAWKAPPVASAVSFAFSIMALVMDWVGAHLTGFDAEVSAVCALVMAVISLATEWYANTASDSGPTALLKSMDTVVAIADTVALIGGGAVLAAQLG